MQAIFRLTLLFLVLLVISCKSYTIPIESFKEQMFAAGPENMKSVEVNNPLIGFHDNIAYKANTIQSLVVFDKNGNQTFLNNSPSIEMRITLKNGKKRIFYFDTVSIENKVLSGSQSRFINKRRQIPLDSIIKIEVQEGRKKFRYQ